jgi:hypothetical protein
MGDRPSPPPPDIPLPQKVRKPHKTVTGRVVYDRRLHLFSLKDCVRILDSAQTGSDDFEIHWKFWKSVISITERFAQRWIDIAWGWGEWYVLQIKYLAKKIIGQWLMYLGQMYGILSEAQRKAFDLVQNNYMGI